MNGRWLLANRDFLVRDLVRDYCTVYSLLADQRRRFDVDGAVSYTALRDLLGEAMRKGVFWRLKDTAITFSVTARHRGHGPRRMPPLELPLPEEPADENGNAAEMAQITALRRHADSVLPGGAQAQKAFETLIDWCIGYAFHECAKLKEDAFQGQHYANRLIQISRRPGVTADMYNPLRGLGGQTSESSSRELSRIMHVLAHGLRLLTSYLAVERHNAHLARWLATEEDFARQVFGAGLRAPSGFALRQRQGTPLPSGCQGFSQCRPPQSGAGPACPRAATAGALGGRALPCCTNWNAPPRQRPTAPALRRPAAKRTHSPACPT